MKCRHCAKDIPEGFTDCPWCGEPAAALPPSFSVPAAVSAAVPTTVGPPVGSAPPARTVAASIVFVLSLVVVTLAALIGTARRYGHVSHGTYPYLLGAWWGPYIVSASIVLAYYAITRKQAHDSTKLLAAFSGASLFAILSLATALSTPPPAPVADPELARHVASVLQHPYRKPVGPASVWDPVMVSVFSDLKSFNDQYLSEVSRLDSSAQPLYTPESFRDAATIQQHIEQLRDRLAVAERFSDLEPVLEKAKGYVAAVNASENDKRDFLAGFLSTARQGVAVRKAASDAERAWLHASIDLYQFMLANHAVYTISADGHGDFHDPKIGDAFKQRLQKVYALRQQFMQAHRAFTAGQDAARAQLGIAP